MIEKIGDFIGKRMAILALVVAATALIFPATGLWIPTKSINYLLMAIMFGMGLTLSPRDFALVFKRPKDVLVGCAAQFLVMPTLAFVLCRLFKLDPGLTAGVVLVGACPGGTASNVMTYLAKGDVALSVGMTSVNTLLAPILTPAIAYLSLRASIDVDVVGMFLGIVQVVLAPIGLGLVINRYFEKTTRRLVRVLPAISSLAICAIIATVMAHNADKILESGLAILAVVVLHNLLGYCCGFGVGKLVCKTPAKTKALALEVGMQNSGLATSLAQTAFSQLATATVPGAIFSAWHNISGALFAGILRRWKEAEPGDESEGEKLAV
ncbi:MAG: bile acid:sodium symporter family protein [Thermoguttaceae bacterium]|nr:bile acid:sodium symporter family protein [Thermoguttaceae bacterium]